MFRMLFGISNARSDAPSKPALWYTITPVFNDMAMITYEKEGSAVPQIYLHSDKA